jgi:hypothetical protein
MTDAPAYITAFKELTKARPTIDDVKPMEQEFYEGSDRSCGVLFGSWVDSALESAIKSVLRSDLSSTLSKRLFDHEGIAGSFGARINLAYALAIFGQKTNHDLGLIRMIRNEFAHCRLPIQFELSAVRSVCDHLQIPDTDQAVSPLYGRSLVGMAAAFESEQWRDKSHPKTRFVTCCHSIIQGLLDFSQRTHRAAMERSQLP